MKLIDISTWMEDFTFPGNPVVQKSGPHNRVSGSNPEFVYDVTLCTQSGTHVQGAHYFLKDGKKINEYPIDCFEGVGFLLDCTGIEGDVSIAFCREKLHHLPLEDAILLLRSDYFFKLSQSIPVKRIGLSAEAARYLAEERKVKMIGIDAPGVESRFTENFEINVYLCQQNVLILEGLTNLDKIPSGNFLVSCFPLKIRGVEGTPCRAIVRIEE